MLILFTGCMSDNLIVPSKGVGKFRIGKSLLTDILKNEQEDRKKYADQGLYFSFDKGKLLSIEIASAEFHTREGIKIGSNVNEIYSVYGKPNSKLKLSVEGSKPFEIDNSLKYQGIGFFCDKNNEIEVITIFDQDIY